VIGCEDCLQNDLYCVRWGVKLYSIQSIAPSSVPSSRRISVALTVGAEDIVTID